MKLNRSILSAVLLATIVSLTGCPEKPGPAQRAGEKLDRAVDKASDAVDPKGPAEKAGRKLDRAIDK